MTAAALAAPVRAGPSTAPAIDWDNRIRSALSETGSLSGVSAELEKAVLIPTVRRARVRVALEQGDLAAAAKLLTQAVAETPNDPSLLEQLSRVQEMTGQADAARRSLTAARSAAPDAAGKARLSLRLATLAFDGGRPEDGLKRLEEAVAADATCGARAGMIAYVYGQFSAAAGYFRSQPAGLTSARLLEGNAALKAGQTDVAAKAFDAALAAADKPADRAYAIERQIATARQAKTLGRLADAWLAQKDLPAERLLPLATVLRELNRVPELISLWRTESARPGAADVLMSERFVNEVLGAAQAAGRGDDAVAVCRDMLARKPDDWQWLTATVRAQLNGAHADDADALLRQRLGAVADVPASVQRLGRLARSFGRDTVAVEAADRLATFGGGNAVSARLLAASVYDRAGDKKNAAAALADATALARQHPVAVNEVVSALEAAGQDKQAVDLLQATIATTPDNDLLGRLASLMLKLGQNRQAMPVLERVMRSAGSPAVRQQSAQRLLEAATSARATGGLIKSLQDRIAAGEGDDQDLSLLVDAQLADKKFDAAVKTIQDSKLIDEPARLRRLTVLYLRNKKLDQADATLRKLVDADPANAKETLERLASVAIDRKKPADIASAIDALQKHSGDGAASIETMAGVLNRLGRTGEAAGQYRRLLAINPENADDWLLWSTAMGKTKQGAIARRRLQVLCGEAPTDNVFAIAVDGLLNLNAPPDTLAVVRRDAVLRLSERPTKMMLYHVLADVSEELGDPATVVRATEASVAVSDEERAQRLRQLMEIASQNALIDTAVDCGRSLLALGDEFPPQLFLQLGGQLLIGGRPDDASRAFARAAESGDPDFIAKHAAGLLEQYDYPALALDTLRPLADRRRNDLEFRRHLAGLAEVIGRRDEAFAEYFAASQLATRGVKVEQTAGASPFRMNRPQSTALDRPLDGLLVVARSPEERERVMAMLEKPIRDAIADPAVAAPPAELDMLTGGLRTAAAFFDEPARADRVDDEIVKRWPDAQAFKARVVQDRAQAGRLASADAFAAANGVPPTPALQRYRQTTQSGPATLPATVTLQWAADTLPLLMVRGRYDEARAVLAAVSITDADKSPKNVSPGLASPFRTLVMAATALGDDATATRVALTWFDSFEKPKPATRPATAPAGATAGRVTGTYSTLPSSYTALVSSSWQILTDAAKSGLIDQMRERMTGVEQPQARASLALYVLRLSAATGRAVPDAAAVGATAVGGQTYNLAESAGQALAMIPAADRPAFLRTAFDGVAENRRLTTLLAVVGRMNGALDPLSADAVIDLAAHTPADQAVDWGDWFISGQDPRVLRALADAVLKNALAAEPGEVAHSANRAAAAAALANAGDAVRADAMAAEALASMALYAPPQPVTDVQQRVAMMRNLAQQPERGTMLRVAVAAMSPGARTAALAKLDAGGPAYTQADQTWRTVLRAALLDATGDRGGALVALRDGLSRDPNDPLLIQLYRDRLTEDGRQAELAALAPRTAGTGLTANVLRPDVSNALRDLFRWREVPTQGDVMIATPDFQTPAAAGDADKLAATMRGALQRTRDGGWPGQLFVSGPGGLASPPVAPRTTEPPAVLSDFAAWPGTLDDVMLTLHCDGVNGMAADWLAALVTRVAATDDRVRTRLMDRLNASAAAGTVTIAERTVIGLLARTPGFALPQTLIDAMTPAAIVDPTGTDMRRLADAMASKGDSPAAAKWAELNVMSGTRVGGPGSGPGNAGAGGPLDTPNDSVTAARIGTLADKDPDAAARAFDSALASGRIMPRSIGSRLVGVRLLAERGDLNGYAAALDAVLHDWAWQQVAGRSMTFTLLGNARGGDLDVTLALPVKADEATRAAAADAVRESLDKVAGQWPWLTDTTRALAAAGAWRAKSAGPAAAEALLQSAVRSAERQGVGEHQLWVADLADRTGHAELSTRIQRTLLENRCLPAGRIAPLLRTLQESGDAETARRLAADAAAYCAEPRLQKLAAAVAVSSAQ